MVEWPDSIETLYRNFNVSQLDAFAALEANSPAAAAATAPASAALASTNAINVFGNAAQTASNAEYADEKLPRILTILRFLTCRR